VARAKAQAQLVGSDGNGGAQEVGAVALDMFGSLPFQGS
jgi:hypothetical protein